MRYSRAVEDFLSFVNESEKSLPVVNANEEEANQQTQDILHAIEMGNYNVRRTVRMTKLLQDVRLRRRDAKDESELCTCVVNWANANRQAVEALKKMLGELRKAEKRIENRQYMNRTDIMEVLK